MDLDFNPTEVDFPGELVAAGMLEAAGSTPASPGSPRFPKFLRSLLPVLAILLLSPPVDATRLDGYRCVHAKDTSGSIVWIDDLGLDSSRSFTIDIQGASLLAVDLQYTHANNGALTLTCTGKSSPDSSGTVVDTTLTTCSVLSGTCTLNDGGVFVNPSLSADKDYSVLVGVAGQYQAKCTVSHGGSATASDKIKATGRLCVH